MDPYWPDDLGQVQWGPVSAWVSGLLTGISVMVAALAYRRSVINSESSQADLVAAWFLDTDHTTTPAIIAVRNSSNLPVYRFAMTIERAGKASQQRFFIGTLAPEMVYEIKTELRMSSIVPPDYIEFTDNRGIAWQRDMMGKLTRLTPTPWSLRRRRILIRVRHPIYWLKWVFPSHQVGDPTSLAGPFHGDPENYIPEWRDQAIESSMAEYNLSHEEAEHCIDKYMSGRRLTRFQKEVVATAIANLPPHSDEWYETLAKSSRDTESNSN